MNGPAIFSVFQLGMCVHLKMPQEVCRLTGSINHQRDFEYDGIN